MGRSLLLGTAIGTAAGTAVGGILNRKPKGFFIGAAIGSALGAGGAYTVHQDQKLNSIMAELPLRPPLKPMGKKDDIVPNLTKPEVRRIWEPERVDGNRFIHGHFIDVLERNSEWSQ